jgi:hypothetical protein
VPAKVKQLASLRIVRMMKFLRESAEGIRCIQSRGLRVHQILRSQAGACMTVPHTPHVRRDKFE